MWVTPKTRSLDLYVPVTLGTVPCHNDCLNFQGRFQKQSTLTSKIIHVFIKGSQDDKMWSCFAVHFPLDFDDIHKCYFSGTIISINKSIPNVDNILPGQITNYCRHRLYLYTQIYLYRSTSLIGQLVSICALQHLSQEQLLLK